MPLSRECISFCIQCLVSLLTDSSQYTLDQIREEGAVYLIRDIRLLLFMNGNDAFAKTVCFVSTDPSQRSNLRTLTAQLDADAIQVAAIKRVFGYARLSGGRRLVSADTIRARCRDFGALYLALRHASLEECETILTVSQAYMTNIVTPVCY